MHLTLHLTDRCNLACRYCYQRQGTAEMSFETAMRSIEECAAGEENVGIIFFGGEPLLKAELIFQIIDACEVKAPQRFHYKVTTNGTLLTSEFVSRATAVRFSGGATTSAGALISRRPVRLRRCRRSIVGTSAFSFHSSTVSRKNSLSSAMRSSSKATTTRPIRLSRPLRS